MHVLIAADKFKNSLKSDEVAYHLRKGLLRGEPGLTVETVTIADGGEGTVAAAISAGFYPHKENVTGPVGGLVEASFAVREHEAVIEVASASGISALPNGKLDAIRATSRGTGELIKYALDADCTSIYLGAGGSASSDGGAGLLTSLGAKFLDASGQPLKPGGGALTELARVDLSELDPRLHKTEFVLASDVNNPLLGPEGAAAVFGPQKGATDAEVRQLEAGLGRLVDALENTIGIKARVAALQSGAGAAGGIGYAALSTLNARFEPGVEFVARLINLQHRIGEADLVITGEGSLDSQTLRGKAPMGVSQAAALAGVPAVAVCGRTTLSEQSLTNAGFIRTYSLTSIEPDVKRSMENASELLEIIGATIAIDVLGQRAHSSIIK